MKKPLMLLICLTMTYSLLAQEQEPVPAKVKQKEIGLVFRNLDNFGLTFKTGTDKSLWRFNALFMNGYNMVETEDSTENNQKNMGFGITFGREYRKILIKNMELRYGLDVTFTYSHYKSDNDDLTVFDYDKVTEQTNYTPGINLVFGLNYVLANKLVFGAELLPYFSYTSGTFETKYSSPGNEEEVKSEVSGFNYGLTNSSVLLSVTYRF